MSKSSSSNKASSSSSFKSKKKASPSSQICMVKCVLDYENCKIPSNYQISELKTKIQAALNTAPGNFQIEGKIYAVGPNYGDSYNKLMSRLQEYEVFTIPQIYMQCESDNGCNTYVVRGERHDPNPEEQVIRKTDIADLYLAEKMYMDAFHTSAVLIISSDSDFISSIIGLNEESITTLLAVEDKDELSPDMFGLAKFTWYWKSDNPGESMIYGGRHLGQNYRRPRPARG